MARKNLVDRLVQLVGSDAFQVIDRGNSWPSIADIKTTTGSVRLALHLSQVGSHSRAPYEKRFQNPADRAPVVAPMGSLPLLIGLQDRAREIVVSEGRSREGRAKRFSILFHALAMLRDSVIGSVNHFGSQPISAFSKCGADFTPRPASIGTWQSVYVLKNEYLGLHDIQDITVSLKKLTTIVIKPDNSTRTPTGGGKRLARGTTDDTSDALVRKSSSVELANILANYLRSRTEAMCPSDVHTKGLAEHLLDLDTSKDVKARLDETQVKPSRA